MKIERPRDWKPRYKPTQADRQRLDMTFEELMDVLFCQEQKCIKLVKRRMKEREKERSRAINDSVGTDKYSCTVCGAVVPTLEEWREYDILSQPIFE